MDPEGQAGQGPIAVATPGLCQPVMAGLVEASSAVAVCLPDLQAGPVLLDVVAVVARVAVVVALADVHVSDHGRRRGVPRRVGGVRDTTREPAQTNPIWTERGEGWCRCRTCDM